MKQLLSKDQQAVVNDIRSGHHVLVTGPAGTGKSFLMNYLQETLENFLNTATTGIAAINVGGPTINCFSCTGTYQGTVDEIYEKLMKRHEDAVEQIRSVTYLAIDEVSMMSARHLEMLNEIFKRVRKNKELFGGIQLILTGDFLQLPPIFGEFEEQKYVFESSIWQAANIKVHLLTTVFRQENREFIELLHRVRVGKLTKADEKFIKSEKSRKYSLDSPPLHIFSKNIGKRGANAFNLEHLQRLPKPLYTAKYRAYVKSGKWKEFCKYRQGSLIADNVDMAVGARVMILKNLDFEHKFVNGTVGTITRFREDDDLFYPIIKVDSTGRSYQLKPYTWYIHKTVEGVKELQFSFTQFPLKLSWAITIHKAQGMTLDEIVLDCKGIFATGQLYVGLSRVTSPEGLHVKNFDPKQLKVDEKCLDFYKKVGCY